MNAKNDEIVDIASLAHSLWDGRRLIGLFVLLGGALAALYVFVLATPVYRATSVVMLESREASVGGLDSVLGGLSVETPVVNTEVEVLRGRGLMGRVVDELGLTEDPEFNPTLASPGLIDQLRGLLRGGAGAGPADPERERRNTRDATISTLLLRVDVRAVPTSLVFQITATSTSAEKAADIADAVARQYITDQQRVRFEAAATAAEWLTGQLAELRIGLETAESEVRRFQTGTDLIDAETLAALDRQLKETRVRRDQVAAQLEDAGARLAKLRDRSDLLALAQTSGNSRLLALARGGLTDPADAAEFETILARVDGDMVQNQARLGEQLRSLQTATSGLEGDIERQSQDLIRLEQLVREAESNRLLYEHFQTRLKETSAQMGIQQADSRLLSEAVVPSGPAAPRKGLLLALAVVLGFGLGALVVLLRELQSRTLRTAADAETLTGLPVMAQMPQLPVQGRIAALAWLNENQVSPQAEAVRSLRTSIMLSAVDKAPQVVMLASALPGEGKTTLTVALAQSFTAMGRRVLLLDGDIRRRALSQHLPEERRKGAGLIALLRGEVTREAALRHVAGLGDILMVEDASVSASDLFSSKTFGELLSALRGEYDLILIDTPPVLIVPDARVIGQHCDTGVLVVHWNRTRREQVAEALQQFASVNVPVAGLVFSQISAEGLRRYRHGSYGYYAEERA